MLGEEKAMKELLTLDPAKKLLDELSIAGHLGHEVSDDGCIVNRLAEAVEEGHPVTVAVTRK